MNPLLIRRRGMMLQGGCILPPGYTQVPSVYGLINGAKFVIIPTPQNSAEIYVEAKLSEFANYVPFFGNYKAEAANAIRLITATTEGVFYANLNNRASVPVTGTTNFSVTDWHTYTVKRQGGGTNITIDNYSHSNTGNSGSSNSDAVYLNASNGTAAVLSKYGFYRRIIVSYNGVVYRDYYPCSDPSNVAGFYDVARGVFETSIDSNYPFYVGL